MTKNEHNLSGLTEYAYATEDYERPSKIEARELLETIETDLYLLLDGIVGDNAQGGDYLTEKDLREMGQRIEALGRIVGHGARARWSDPA